MKPMKGKDRKSRKTPKTEKGADSGSDSNDDVGDIFTDEISEFTEARNKIDVESRDYPSESEEEEELFGLVDEDDVESDEELGEWSKRLKQIKFQSKLEKKKSLPDAPEKSWGTKRTAFYGSGVKRKPKQAESDEDDEWAMEEKEIEKLQQKLDADVDEDDFLIPSLLQQKAQTEKQGLTVKRDFSEMEKEEFKKKLHPEAEPLKEELNKCLEELEQLQSLTGWKVESRETCFRLLAANIAFYLHLIDKDEDCRGHPVLKRIVQWKKLAKIYESVPLEQLVESDESEAETDATAADKGTGKKKRRTQEESVKRSRLALEDSEEDLDEQSESEEDENADITDQDTLENRPITYEMEKNKVKKKSAPNNPRVKHREKFRKAKIRRRGKIREVRPEVNKYQGEASGIRAGIVRSIRMK